MPKPCPHGRWHHTFCEVCKDAARAELPLREAVLEILHDADPSWPEHGWVWEKAADEIVAEVARRVSDAAATVTFNP
jgi:hypothetical protein